MSRGLKRPGRQVLYNFVAPAEGQPQGQSQKLSIQVSGMFCIKKIPYAELLQVSSK